MAIRDLLLAYIQQVNTVVVQETQINSLDPDKIGSMGVDLATILLDYLPTLGAKSFTGGTALPSGGQDGDVYFRSTGGTVTIYKKVGATWTNSGNFPLGFTLVDGKIVGLNVTLKDSTVTVTPGQWAVGGVPYKKLTQTQFAVSAAHNTLQRQDLIYAGAGDNLISFLTGTPGMGAPNTPANSIVIDTLIIPSVASKAKPYFLLNSFGVNLEAPGLTPEYISTLPIYDTVAALEASDLVPYDLYRTTSGFIKYKVPEISAMDNNTTLSDESIIA